MLFCSPKSWLTRPTAKYARFLASGLKSGTTRPGERSSAKKKPRFHGPCFPVRRAPKVGSAILLVNSNCERRYTPILVSPKKFAFSRKKGRFSGTKTSEGNRHPDDEPLGR